MRAIYQRAVLSLLGTGLLAASMATPVRANCAAPQTYSVAVQGHTVVVTPENELHRGCPDAAGMLRENTRTHEIVRLADVCGPDPKYEYEDRAYRDECVAPGTYRYGFAEPYACVGYACGTYRYAEVTVTDELGDCQRGDANAVPSTVATAPWKGQPVLICTYEGGGDDEGGCSLRRPGSRTVLAVDAAAGALAGLILLLRRRRPRS